MSRLVQKLRAKVGKNTLVLIFVGQFLALSPGTLAQPQNFRPPINPALRPTILPGEIQDLLADSYVVYVNSDSPLLLGLIRQTTPNASFKIYKNRRVIQTGIFISKSAANYRQVQLEARGVKSNLVQLNKGTEFRDIVPIVSAYIPPVTANYPPNLANYPSAYFVAIRGNPADLNRIATRVRYVGVPATNIFIKNNGVNPFVAIGPFDDINTAKQWQQYLSNSGLVNPQIYNKI